MTTRLAHWGAFLERWTHLQSTLQGRVLKGTFWSLVATMLVQAQNLIGSLLIARALGTEGFGEFSLVNSTILAFGVFAGLGLGLTATKYVAEWRNANSTDAGKILGMSISLALGSSMLFGLALYFLAPWLAINYLNAPVLALPLQVSSFMLFFTVLLGAFVGMLAGFEAFQLMARLNVVTLVVTLVLIIVALGLGDLTNIIVAMSLGAVVSVSLYAIALRKLCRTWHIQISFRFRDKLPILWKFSLPALLSNAMVAPTMLFASTLLVTQGAGFAELGIFNAANQWRALAVFIPNIVNYVAVPVLSNLYGTADQRGFRKVVFMNLGIVTGVSFVFLTLIGLGSAQIMSLYGEEFSGHEQVLLLLLLASFLYAVGNVFGTVLTSQGKMWVGFILNGIWAIAFLATAWNRLASGATGLAIAYLVAYAALLMVTLVYLAMSPQFRQMFLQPGSQV